MRPDMGNDGFITVIDPAPDVTAFSTMVERLFSSIK